MDVVASDWDRSVSTSLFKFKLFIKPEAKRYFVIHRHNLVNINTFLFMPECHYHVIGWDILWEDFQSRMLTYNKQLLSAMDGRLWSSFNSRHHCQSLLQPRWVEVEGVIDNDDYSPPPTIHSSSSSTCFDCWSGWWRWGGRVDNDTTATNQPSSAAVG